MEGKYSIALPDAQKGVLIDESLEDTVIRLSSMTEAAKIKETADKLSMQLPSVITPNKLAENEQHLIKATLKSYTEALKIEPNYAVVYLNRSALYMKVEKYNEALQDCERVLQLLDGKTFSTYDATEPEVEENEDQHELLKPVPPKGAPLYQQIYQRASARIEECKKKLNIECNVHE